MITLFYIHKIYTYRKIWYNKIQVSIKISLVHFLCTTDGKGSVKREREREREREGERIKVNFVYQDNADHN
jgi:hypothetical protein